MLRGQLLFDLLRRKQFLSEFVIIGKIDDRKNWLSQKIDKFLPNCSSDRWFMISSWLSFSRALTHTPHWVFWAREQPVSCARLKVASWILFWGHLSLFAHHFATSSCLQKTLRRQSIGSSANLAEITSRATANFREPMLCVLFRSLYMKIIECHQQFPSSSESADNEVLKNWHNKVVERLKVRKV